jgi:hypothetical protein
MHKSLLPSVVLLCLCLGCGTGEYESRIGQHRTGGAAAAAPDLLGPAEELPGTRITFHAPRCMTPVPQGADPKQVKAVPFTLPGMQMRAYEGFVKDSAEGQMPFGCCIMAIDASKAPGMNLAQMQNMMGKGAAGPATDLKAAGAGGKEISWQTLRVSQKQEFPYKAKNGAESSPSMDAIVEMYFCQDSGYLIFVAWVLPASIEQNIGDVGLADLAKAVAGGVSVKPQ